MWTTRTTSTAVRPVRQIAVVGTRDVVTPTSPQSGMTVSFIDFDMGPVPAPLVEEVALQGAPDAEAALGTAVEVARLAGHLGGDMDAAVEGVCRLPAHLPTTASLAATLVVVIMRMGPEDGLRHARQLDQLLELAERYPPDTVEWRRVRGTARAVATLRAAASGVRVDTRAALADLESMPAEEDGSQMAQAQEVMRAGLAFMHAFHSGDEAALRQLPDELITLQRRFGDLPGPGHHADLAGRMAAYLAARRTDDSAAAWDLHDKIRAAAQDLPEGELRATLDANAVVSAAVRHAEAGSSGVAADQLEIFRRQVSASAHDGGVSHKLVGAAELIGWETDPDRVAAAIESFRRALRDLPPGDKERISPLVLLGIAHICQVVQGARVAGLDAAAEALHEARDLAGGPAHHDWAQINDLLSWVYRRAGRASDARAVALAGLRRYAWNVLLQRDAAAAGTAARNAAHNALDIARSCLAEMDPAAAVQALDAGRGLALFAATEFLDVATRLDRAGRQDLATRWRMAGSGSNDIPTDLRADVLAALSDGDHALAGLLDPPSLPDIRSALTALDIDALVYLVPGVAPAAGWAVLVPAAGPPGLMALPNLLLDVDVNVERLLAAVSARDLAAPPSPETVTGSLDTLCDWAWRAAVGPLVEQYLSTLPPPATDRPPRVVLVPTSNLARVPWQAARRGDGTYAVQLVAFSQAASARMLCRSAAASPVPVLPVGLIVGDPQTCEPTTDLVAARAEAEAIHRAFYPGARYVGRRSDGTTSASGSGTAAEVREWLTTSRPGAGATLHLACHGVIQPTDVDVTSFLLLAGPDGRLTAEELVALLAKTPDRAIGLVVLAACRTGVSGRGYDAAFSLGTAFLAAGVRSVLSTQWSIPDQDTSVLMYMLHHHRMVERRPAWDALRRAQLWMLDPRRSVPPTMPAALVGQLSSMDPAQVVAWAGFVHGGQ